jgi:hypothetical protein
VGSEFQKFEMAVRFYKELDNLRTADFYTDESKRKTQNSGKYFEVERIISRRTRKRKVGILLMCVLSLFIGI